jgi:actin-like ATPase involved in cell morphogenesis
MTFTKKIKMIGRHASDIDMVGPPGGGIIDHFGAFFRMSFKHVALH